MLEEQFWNKVLRTTPNECWLWLGCIVQNGYGQVYINKKMRYAHHVSWELHYKQPWPLGLQARHSCDNPPCVNPHHIIPGTASEDRMDQVHRGRHRNTKKTHCKHGHEFTPENTIIREHGWRKCREQFIRESAGFPEIEDEDIEGDPKKQEPKSLLEQQAQLAAQSRALTSGDTEAVKRMLLGAVARQIKKMRQMRKNGNGA